MRSRSLLLTGCSAAIALGCGGSPTTKSPFDRPSVTLTRGKRVSPPRQAPLAAHRFAEVTDVIGPYVGRDGDVSLAAWAEPAGDARKLLVAPINAKGVPGVPQRVASLAGELDLVLVRGFGEASAKLPGQPRFAVVTTRRGARATSIDLTALRADGAAVWGPTTLAERGGRVLWVGFVNSGTQPLLLWAEQATSAKAGEPANVYALPATVDGKATPSLVTAKACVWQATSVAGQAAVASVRPGPGGCTSGAVAVDLLGASGKPERTVELGGRAALDLDLVGTSDTFILAWSDREQVEPRAMTAVVDTKGAVRSAPAAAVPALGEQAVLALVPGASSQAAAFLVWENLAERPEGARFFEVSTLDSAGKGSGTHARLLFSRADGSAPELAPHAGGVAALTLAPVCGVEENCEGNVAVPTFVALSSELKLQSSEPLLLDALGGRAADLGWGLTCQASGCFALAAPSRSPATLYTVPLPLRESLYRAAAEEAEPLARPRVASSEILLRASAPLAQIAVAPTGEGRYVGYVTDFDPTTPWQKLTKPAEDGRLEPLRARVALRAFAGEGSKPLAEEQVVSLRAHSLGGLAFVDSVAAWTGLDKGQPQVFLTALGVDGKRGQQRMLTRKNGDVSDVAAISVEGGYLVSWVDERTGDAEVYAQRVSRALERAGAEQRLTTAEGAATDLLLTKLGGKPYVVWADARGAEEPGWSDIYGAFVKADGSREGAEHQLTNTRPHSFSARVGALGGTSVLAWLEEGTEGAPSSVRLATLGETGDVNSSVSVVPLEAGAVRGLGLECRDVSCHVLVSVESEGRGELYGFEWRPSATARPVRLLGLGSPMAAVVAPALRGNVAYVADVRDGQGLVRRLGIEW
ncbi:MAG: uncharacterized protein K0R38_1067 [Polyangiaceae bacterium]|nr:uncharacterized protein [Polyangiaceae bacterium]